MLIVPFHYEKFKNKQIKCVVIELRLVFASVWSTDCVCGEGEAACWRAINFLYFDIYSSYNCVYYFYTYIVCIYCMFIECTYIVYIYSMYRYTSTQIHQNTVKNYVVFICKLLLKFLEEEKEDIK